MNTQSLIETKNLSNNPETVLFNELSNATLISNSTILKILQEKVKQKQAIAMYAAFMRDQSKKIAEEFGIKSLPAKYATKHANEMTILAVKT